jgi:hypothetical protein
MPWSRLGYGECLSVKGINAKPLGMDVVLSRKSAHGTRQVAKSLWEDPALICFARHGVTFGIANHTDYLQSFQPEP